MIVFENLNFHTHTVRKCKQLAKYVAWLQQLRKEFTHPVNFHPSRSPFILGGPNFSSQNKFLKADRIIRTLKSSQRLLFPQRPESCGLRTTRTLTHEVFSNVQPVLYDADSISPRLIHDLDVIEECRRSELSESPTSR